MILYQLFKYSRPPKPPGKCELIPVYDPRASHHIVAPPPPPKYWSRGVSIVEDNVVTVVLLTGCLVNGSVYAEGSAMDTSSRCQYCYCIRGRQHCVRPQCVLAETDCVPSYNTDSCCPAKYNCSGSSTSG